MPAWVLPLIFLGFSAGLSNFGGAVGLGVLPLTRRLRLEIVASFLLMEILMPVFGLLLGSRLSGSIGSRGQFVAGLVLIAIGGYTLLETRREAKDLKIPVRRRTIVLLATALSLDNLVVGLGLGLLNAPIVVAAAFMGLCSLALTVIGLELGRQLGSRVGERSELFSGLVLIAAGVFVLVHPG
ncbi:MAG TPA: manganese efflux pump [Candidatus Solibacter sp.]|jgi:putative Mn2+ efflux pump MntP|nr:manganese efflux pump [Candidatus Solibacter sp.]